jgi:hypothetical protein
VVGREAGAGVAGVLGVVAGGAVGVVGREAGAGVVVAGAEGVETGVLPELHATMEMVKAANARSRTKPGIRRRDAMFCKVSPSSI